MSAPDWKAVRAEFPALRDWTHLNTATYGQLPRRATEAVARFFAHRDELACADFLRWFDDMDRLRGKIARLIHCEAEDVAFVPNASTALGVLLAGIDWKQYDNAITLSDEFPNNVYAPLRLQRLGVDFIQVSGDNLLEVVNEHTRLVLVSMLNYTTGFRARLDEIGPLLRERGVLLYVDGTQGLGPLTFDSARVRPAMLAAHGYKWMLAPTGAGFMYVDPELRRRLEPLTVGWRSHRDWRRVDNLHHDNPQLSDAAERYEGGMLPFALLYAMEASLDFIFEIGVEAVTRRTCELAALVRDAVHRLGGEALFDDTPIIAARFEGRDPSILAGALEQQHILVAARHGCLRISPYFYNDESDIARFESELKRLL